MRHFFFSLLTIVGLGGAAFAQTATGSTTIGTQPGTTFGSTSSLNGTSSQAGNLDLTSPSGGVSNTYSSGTSSSSALSPGQLSNPSSGFGASFGMAPSGTTSTSASSSSAKGSAAGHATVVGGPGTVDPNDPLAP